MIHFSKFELKNGLRVIFHHDTATPLLVLNLLYNVGARDETPDKTGFAHLFEHLMFGGSVNIPEFDSPLQLAGGENNAFTNNDITNYYMTLPAENAETAFWLESDRMLSLDFSQRSLDVQKGVVIEEFKQRYLNQPYGDVWLKMRPLVFQKHPYSWATIGKEISHIENASLDDVKDFFFRFYNPNNAILCIAGNITEAKAKELCEKWFGNIEKGQRNTNIYPQEPPQTEKRTLHVNSKVPQDAIYMAFHMSKRTDKAFYAFDLISDILSRGESSRFYKNLVMDKQLFTELDAYVTSDLDPGLFVIQGKLTDKCSFEMAEEAIWQELEQLKNHAVSDIELSKVKNKAETYLLFSQTSVLNKAMALCMAENMGDANRVNTEMEKYASVSPSDIANVANTTFQAEKSNILYYHAEK